MGVFCISGNCNDVFGSLVCLLVKRSLHQSKHAHLLRSMPDCFISHIILTKVELAPYSKAILLV